MTRFQSPTSTKPLRERYSGKVAGVILTCMLAIALSVLGCGSDGDRGSVRTSGDTTHPVSLPAAGVSAAVAAEGQLRVAMARLLQGNTAPASDATWFSAATAGALRNVSVDSAGHALIDFADLQALIPNASSSAGSEMLLAELNAAVFGVAGVRSVDYLIEGRCERFWEWLQRACQTVRRPD